MQANNGQTQVDDHRNMLMLTKKISEFQEQNLKSWAFIFFNGVEKVKVSWNFIRRNSNKDFYAGKVDFDIKFKKGSGPTDTGINQLIASTKFLFWSETKVNIKINGIKWKIKLTQDQVISHQKNEKA